MEYLVIALLYVGAVLVSSVLDQFLRGVSLPLVQMAVGVAIYFFADLPIDVTINSELFLVMFIAPLLFDESRNISNRILWDNRNTVLSLAIALVVVSVLVVGFVLHWLVPSISLAAAFALGAALGPTDAVAVASLGKTVKLGSRQKASLLGEALLNDASGIVSFQFAIAAAVTGSFSLADASWTFVVEFVGGIILGLFLGAIAFFIMQRMRRAGVESATVHVCFELFLPFFVYLVATRFHVSGILAVVAAGLLISYIPQRMTVRSRSFSTFSTRLNIASESVWHLFSFVLNGVIFVLLGMQLPRFIAPAADGGFGDPWLMFGVVIVLTLILEIVRFCWIAGMDIVHCLVRKQPVRTLLDGEHFRSALATAFAGPKGGITLSLILTVPATLPASGALPVHTMLASIASGVILCTLLLANFAVPALVPHKADSRRTKRQVDAEARLLMRVIESVRADAHRTGSVTGEASAQMAAANDDVDEPATVIVMKRYADQLADIVKRASADVAAQARQVIAQCDEQYERIEELDSELRESGFYDGDEEAGDPSTLTAHFRALRDVYDAVEDVQAQALARELEYVKEMAHDGQIDPKHAKELRNDVYIQQLTL